MSKHPMSWSVIPLGQEIEVKKGKKPIFLHGAPNEDLVPYVDIKAFEKLNIRQYADQNSGVIAEANDTLMVWDGARSGLVGNGIAGVIGSTLMRIRPKSSDRNYLHQFLKYKFSQINSNTKGTGIPHVSPEFLFGIDIPLAPLNEQKRIADKLDAVLARVDACRDRLDRIPAILKRFRQSVLAAATSGKLTEDWRAESTNGNEWRQVQLSEVARDLSYGTSAKSSKSGAIPVLRMGNIQDGRLDWNSLVYTSDLKEITKYRLASGDVLFNRTNSPELVGKTAVFKGEREAVYAGYLVRVRCLPQLLPDYLNYCLGSSAGRDYCWQVKSDGVSQSNINAKKLAAFSFLLPSVEEQTEIVRRVEALFAYADRLEARYTAARAQVEKLTPATLAKAFRGELVPQDPNDEPASKLLERIHAISTSESTKSGERKHKNKEPVS